MDSQQNTPIILGIDPGTRITGYGIIQIIDSHFKVLDYGSIRPPTTYQDAQKYLTLFNAIDLLLEKHHPGYVVVESQFVYKNVLSALKLGKAQGMALLAAARRNIPIYEYAPKVAKRAVVGTGSASKYQVQKMIQMLLKLPCIPEPEDAADALALAICLAHTLTSKVPHV